MTWAQQAKGTGKGHEVDLIYQKHEDLGGPTGPSSLLYWSVWVPWVVTCQLPKATGGRILPFVHL